MAIFISVVMFLSVQGALGQLIQVDPEVMSYPGQNVELPCKFVNPGSTQVSQVSWILEPSDGERINIAVYHPTFGASYPDSPVTGRVTFIAPTLDTPSIRIADVKMTDEGRYICEYATYPTGNAQGITNLVMLAKPKNSASHITVVAGDTPVVVARCASANGRPVSQIRWVTSVNGNATTSTTQESDNTVTLRSDYKLIPTPADNGKDISCVVEHRTQTKPESFPMKLAIEYPPMVSIVGYDDNWYMGRTNVELTCQAKGNPIPTTVTWRTLTGHMPDTVQVTENKLKVLKVDETVNTTFICEVRNRLGIGKNQVTVNVRATPCVCGGDDQSRTVGKEWQGAGGRTGGGQEEAATAGFPSVPRATTMSRVLDEQYQRLQLEGRKLLLEIEVLQLQKEKLKLELQNS
ncbi:nectin-2 isoform X3 [Alosa pseudoharengus]|uniref:nectin-2 isoform X3 n=1 Tax=Alosa pseudoharengus TaxID=34774 RepID=UPI003F8CB07A